MVLMPMPSVIQNSRVSNCADSSFGVLIPANSRQSWGVGGGGARKTFVMVFPWCGHVEGMYANGVRQLCQVRHVTDGV